MNKTIVIGITGGIAAFKALDLIRDLKQKSYKVIVIMTKSATQMVNLKEFESVSGSKVYRDLFEEDFDYKTILEKRKVDHIIIADAASLFVIIPATANIITKIAYGIADDFLTTSILATKAPIFICPSMNVNMWKNPVVQENIAKAKLLGFQFIDPDSGMLACGYTGKGRLADITKIEESIRQLLYKTEVLKGRKILVTAGGTVEPIDDIRFITNRSSGKMGVAIAEACYQRGADVLLLKAKNAVSPRFPIKELTFDTADALTTLLKNHVSFFDICFHTAAISDFSIESKQDGKISSSHKYSLNLVPREKILKLLKQYSPLLKIIAFKAEWNIDYEKLYEIALGKIKEFKIEAIIANDVSKKGHGFEVDSNEVLIVTKDGKQKLIPLAPKRVIANEIVDYLISSVDSLL